MADLLDRQHADAALSLLAADVGPPPLVTLDGVVPNGTVPPYAVVYTHIERPADHPGNDLGGTSDTYVVRWYVYCVGDTARAAIAVGMRVRAALLDVRPVIAGRSCGPIRLDSSAPPTRDESTGRLVMSSLQIWRLTTTG